MTILKIPFPSKFLNHLTVLQDRSSQASGTELLLENETSLGTMCYESHRGRGMCRGKPLVCNKRAELKMVWREKSWRRKNTLLQRQKEFLQEGKTLLVTFLERGFTFCFPKRVLWRQKPTSTDQYLMLGKNFLWFL